VGEMSLTMYVDTVTNEWLDEEGQKGISGWMRTTYVCLTEPGSVSLKVLLDHFDKDPYCGKWTLTSF